MKRSRTRARWQGLSTLCLAGFVTACSDGVNVASGVASSPADEPAFNLSVHDDGFRGAHFSGSDQCGDCHDGLTAASGRNVSIRDDWSTSMMANASRDPYWIARVATEQHRLPSRARELDVTCSRCHAPMASVASERDNTPFRVLGEEGVLDSAHPYFNQAMEGVSCTLCHQIEDDGLMGTRDGDSGRFSVNIASTASERVAYGPYPDPAVALMQSQVRFLPSYGPHLQSSNSCAACHDLRAAIIDSDGQALEAHGGSGFAEQMVFSEWRASDFADDGTTPRSCQSCHMPEVPSAMAIANRGSEVRRRGVNRHDFLGANTVMQALLANNRDPLGIRVPAERFAESIARNRAFLATAASIDMADIARSGDQLEATIHIVNRSGHKLPSGYPSRRVYVHFTVRDAANAIVFESGRTSDDGSVVGLDDSTDAFSPHRTLVTSASEVQVYESIMADSAGNVTESQALASSYLKDNRLLPAGFDTVRASPEVAVYGLAANDPDFSAAGDTVRYRVPVPASGQLAITARLVYQPIGFQHVQDLFEDADLPEVARFKQMWEAADLRAEILASVTRTLE